MCLELSDTFVSVYIVLWGHRTERARVVEDSCKVWSRVSERVATLIPEELLGNFLYIFCT